MRLAGLDAPCSPRNLRATQLAFSRLFLVCLCYIASVAVQRLRQTFAQPRALALSPPAVTGALWVAAVGSFPVLFFCGVLYYTDMLSAGLVVASAAAAGSFAWQLHAPPPSPLRSWASAAVSHAADDVEPCRGGSCPCLRIIPTSPTDGSNASAPCPSARSPWSL